ncbi:hypothetical protein FC20_GL000120 [Lactobacillus equicursoris DSM 19284 = JCM 14600 = CIP 110162]|uniref:Uncharacterized protein n=2 Tax=Lactobacillus equicursoris TaxID=420645 RepID=A0A0R1M6T8_9LACO|nr:hypothetical protein FC20_GL000120 [Lactobacillus equicursoris DSM 19284 = JCM 14600 = CIP 110162]
MIFILWLCWKIGIGFLRVILFLIGAGLVAAFAMSLLMPLLALIAVGGAIFAAAKTF